MVNNSARIGELKRLLKQKPCLKIIEAHSKLSAIIANNAEVVLPDGTHESFDGFWEGSLTDSASKLLPDIEIVGLNSRLETISQILSVTTKPMIVDGDTGGDLYQF